MFQKAWDKAAGSASCSTRSATSPPTGPPTKPPHIHPQQDRRDRQGPGDGPQADPTDLYAKRPLCDSGYYATFNRDNVELVSVKETPIVEITPKGISTADGVEHELDVLIFATGFDAVDGNYTRMDIRGRNGETIQRALEGRARPATSVSPPRDSRTCS